MTDAINVALAQDTWRTGDLGGQANTESCGKAIAKLIAG
jgi:isocitrate/isopropylmalate dehydrogenase